jgi:hypothetical protein
LAVFLWVRTRSAWFSFLGSAHFFELLQAFAYEVVGEALLFGLRQPRLLHVAELGAGCFGGLPAATNQAYE